MNNVSNKSCRENRNTHFMFDNIYIYIYIYTFFENRAVYEIMWKNFL